VEEIDRYLDKVDELGPDACWPWEGSLNDKDYGNFWAFGKCWKAHRFGYEALVGPIPPGLDVCHSCDTPWCQNPGHWWLGTNNDNCQDKVKKGRQRAPRGIEHWCNKISPEVVEEIRSRYKRQHRFRRDGLTQIELAAEYGLSQSHIHQIVSGKRWKPLKTP
jgi:hypothetical protein